MKQISHSVFEYTGIITRTKHVKCKYCGRVPEDTNVKQYQANRVLVSGVLVRCGKPKSRGLNMAGWIAILEDNHAPGRLIYRICPECYQNGRKK